MKGNFWVSTSTPEFLCGQIIHDPGNKSSTCSEQHRKLSPSIFAIKSIFETAALLRAVTALQWQSSRTPNAEITSDSVLHSTELLPLAITDLSANSSADFLECSLTALMDTEWELLPKRILLSAHSHSKETGFLLGQNVFNILFKNKQQKEEILNFVKFCLGLFGFCKNWNP